jgi:hypothetical protein
VELVESIGRKEETQIYKEVLVVVVTLILLELQILVEAVEHIGGKAHLLRVLMEALV